MKIEFHPEAESEVEATVDYYNLKQPGVAQSFLEELKQAILRIKEDPESFATELSGFRACRLKSFPLSVYYCVFGEVIYIGAVHIIQGNRDIGAREFRKIDPLLNQ